MKKTIILSENSFKKIKRFIIKEALNSAPIFGKRDNYSGHLKTLEKKIGRASCRERVCSWV